MFYGHWGFHLSLAHTQSTDPVIRRGGGHKPLCESDSLTLIHLRCDTGFLCENKRGGLMEGGGDHLCLRVMLSLRCDTGLLCENKRGGLMEGGDHLCMRVMLRKQDERCYQFCPILASLGSEHLLVSCLFVPNLLVAKIKNPYCVCN